MRQGVSVATSKRFQLLATIFAVVFFLILSSCSNQAELEKARSEAAKAKAEAAKAKAEAAKAKAEAGAGKATESKPRTQICLNCRGTGSVLTDCKYCNGLGKKYCSDCKGTGKNPFNSTLNCLWCQGVGSWNCSDLKVGGPLGCKGSGKVSTFCAACGGSGRVKLD